MNLFLPGLVQAGLLTLALVAVYRPLGDYMARVYTTNKHWKLERAIYRVVRIDADSEQKWSTYAVGVLGFSFVSIVFVYLLQRFQTLLPFDFGRSAVDPSVAMNTAISFVTNTN